MDSWHPAGIKARSSVPKKGSIVPNLGFLSLSLTGYLLLGLGAALALSLLALKIQSARLDSAKAEHAAFVEKVRVQGELAEKQAREKENQDKRLKERTDADYKTRIARLERDNKRLRDSAPSRYLPPASPGAPSPDRATVSRSVVDGALRDFEAEVAGLIAEGDLAREGLDTAKRWSQER